MGDEEADEILAALGLDEEATESPERRFERRVVAAMVDARRAGVDYWRLFELIERQQRAAVRASFSGGEFGDDHSTVDEETIQYSQVVHATARALDAGASERRLLFNLASAYQLFEDDWSGEQ
ncbi:hypothetical protein ZOD2009_03652 [Haladaptatus paucihalophilus DX253]|uniref:Uncharacterized protein n=1 Tax=Haladaptatus paucihalophilus DX253 TaxID=797209 RepID=E7QPJ2_HALPU|nr:hypothetical protein [Haladaptatus paucihalophilus]EFW93475.1 hypothetical protein ZOD2009_03652 [Haladaptatus paucihalophilus DX253]SHL20129.1 hypothetical protein SAMN05444342_3242 [Haladaptatus paucihalophilus DX253]